MGAEGKGHFGKGEGMERRGDVVRTAEIRRAGDVTDWVAGTVRNASLESLKSLECLERTACQHGKRGDKQSFRRHNGV